MSSSLKLRLETALLEFARLLVFSIPGILIQVITNDPLASTTYGGLILGALKSWDRGVHEDPTTPSRGILPF